jgi:hypothetical protein
MLSNCAVADTNKCPSPVPSNDGGTTDEEMESRDLVMPLKSAVPKALVVSAGYVIVKDPRNGRNILRVPMVRTCIEEIAGAGEKTADFFVLNFRDGMDYFIRFGDKTLSYQGKFENAGHTRATCMTSEGKCVLDKLNWALVLFMFLDSKWPALPTARIDFMLVADQLIVRCLGLVDKDLASCFRYEKDDGTKSTISSDEMIQFRFTFKEVNKLPTTYVDKGLPRCCKDEEDEESPVQKKQRV